jgi:hypothetical protein
MPRVRLAPRRAAVRSARPANGKVGIGDGASARSPRGHAQAADHTAAEGRGDKPRPASQELC